MTAGVTAGVTLGVLTGVATGVVGVGVVGVGVGVGGAGAGAMGTAKREAHCTAGFTGATMAAKQERVSVHIITVLKVTACTTAAGKA